MLCFGKNRSKFIAFAFDAFTKNEDEKITKKKKEKMENRGIEYHRIKKWPRTKL